MNNSIIKLLITLVTFSSISLVDSHLINKRSPKNEGVIVGPETPVYYLECSHSDCLSINSSVNKFKASPSYDYYRNPENQLNNTFFPKLLVILDWDSEIENGEQAILNKVLTRWNAADKYYETLDNPKIKLAIAGVIIPTKPDSWKTIITETRIQNPEPINTYMSPALLRNVTKWLDDNSDHFKSINYDGFIFLSRWPLIRLTDNPQFFGTHNPSVFNCSTKNGSHYHSIGGIVHKNEYVSLNVAYIIGAMFHDATDEQLGCESGYLMDRKGLNLNATWSECFKQAFRSIINNRTYSCLRQIPYDQYEDDYTFFHKNE